MYSGPDQQVIEIDDDDQHDRDPTSKLLDNKPRKIIFCVDVSAEMNEEMKPSANSGIKNTTLYHSSRMETVQRLLKRYASINKMIGNTSDEYAIITLSDEASWLFDFSSDIARFNKKIDFLNSQAEKEYHSLDTQSLFDTIALNASRTDNNYFVHVIVLYARTNVLPDRLKKENYSKIRDSPNFAMDVVFMHDQTSDVQDVYDIWNEFDSVINPGWYYETGSQLGKDKLSKALSELIAHPLQRSKNQEEFISTPIVIKK